MLQQVQMSIMLHENMAPHGEQKTRSDIVPITEPAKTTQDMDDTPTWMMGQ